MDDNYWSSFSHVLSLNDLTEVTGKGSVTIWRWLNRGILPGHQIAGSWIVYREEIRAKLLDADSAPLIPSIFLSTFPDRLDVPQLATLLGKTEQTAYNWLAANEVKGHKVSSAWLVYKSEFEELLLKTSNQAPGYQPKR